MSDTVKWLGLEFVVCPFSSDSWNEVAGLYIFAGKNSEGLWYPPLHWSDGITG